MLIPNHQFWLDRGFQLQFYNPRKLEKIDLQSTNSPLVLVPRFELDMVARVLTSPDWRAFVEHLHGATDSLLITSSHSLISEFDLLAGLHSAADE